MLGVVELRVSETSVGFACCFQTNSNFTTRSEAGCHFSEKYS
jgi:hypothetical protein